MSDPPPSPRPWDLSGQTILVTGAAGGIGAATARLCAGLGAQLLLTDARDPAETEAGIRAAGGTAASRIADLGDRDALAELGEWAAPADGAVIAAGLYEPLDWTDPEFDRALDDALAVNLVAPIRLARRLCAAMAARGAGRLVMLGSIAAATGGSFPGVGPHYSVSKGGLHTLVRWLAARHAPQGVLVNGVAPGVTATRMMDRHDMAPALARHPMGRMATPEEIAWPIAFLLSPGASFVAGAILDVNGGSMMRP